MSVSNQEFGLSQDEYITGFRLGWENRIITPNIIPVDAMPVQYLNPVGAMTVKLPLAAPNGRVWFLSNQSAQVVTVTDSADAAIAGGTLASGQTGVYQKVGAVYLKMGEMPIPA